MAYDKFHFDNRNPIFQIERPSNEKCEEDVFLIMSDWDNSLGGFDEEENMMDAVRSFNEDNGTDFNPVKMLKYYKEWKRKLNQE